MAIKNCIRKILVSFLGSGMAVRSCPPSRSLPLTCGLSVPWSVCSASSCVVSSPAGGLLGSVVGMNGWLVGFVRPCVESLDPVGAVVGLLGLVVHRRTFGVRCERLRRLSGLVELGLVAHRRTSGVRRERLCRLVGCVGWSASRSGRVGLVAH